VLRSSYGLPSGRSSDRRSGPLSGAQLDGIWGFHLRPAPGSPDPSGDLHPEPGRPRLCTRPFCLLVGEPVHFIMQTCQFRNMRAGVGAQA
jgi:hypothetical protein